MIDGSARIERHPVALVEHQRHLEMRISPTGLGGLRIKREGPFLIAKVIGGQRVLEQRFGHARAGRVVWFSLRLRRCRRIGYRSLVGHDRRSEGSRGSVAGRPVDLLQSGQGREGMLAIGEALEIVLEGLRIGPVGDHHPIGGFQIVRPRRDCRQGQGRQCGAQGQYCQGSRQDSVHFVALHSQTSPIGSPTVQDPPKTPPFSVPSSPTSKLLPVIRSPAS